MVLVWGLGPGLCHGAVFLINTMVFPNFFDGPHLYTHTMGILNGQCGLEWPRYALHIQNSILTHFLYLDLRLSCKISEWICPSHKESSLTLLYKLWCEEGHRSSQGFSEGGLRLKKIQNLLIHVLYRGSISFNLCDYVSINTFLC